MSLLNKIGKKHVELATQWFPTAATFGAAAFTSLLYFTDWKIVVAYIPFYNTKFKSDEE